LAGGGWLGSAGAWFGFLELERLDVVHLLPRDPQLTQTVAVSIGTAARQHHQRQEQSGENPKFEIRNPKQIQNPMHQ
jgi:hypothetical protein